jgi:hypothetical protein
MLKVFVMYFPTSRINQALRDERSAFVVVM